ncbi:helix-turn-helix transcriptional regulator [Pseudorhodoferax sp. Leaf267]|uniref:helix-turn-helix transcriptional regulator n=1 Tax=Pseudorhodoferax sp. Leaf267 TaxID=1736316 RepID=UPI0006FBE26C|nr:helix-turn-helix transcriptional regulator [Pseudorhodoferax sp. Leaf267]KQP19766.1 hypothetical protein ASF43_28445 [Pseudorhodoferax sp. Leaf267]
MTQAAALSRALDALQTLDDPDPRWGDVLEGFRQCVGGDSARLLMFGGDGELLLVQREGGDAQADSDYAAHFHAHDFLLPLARGSGAGVWNDSAEALTAAALDRNVFYVDFLCRHRIRQVVAHTAVDGLRTLALSVQRSQPRGGMRAVVESAATRQFTATLARALQERQACAVQAWASLDACFSAYGEALLLVTPSGVVLHLSALAREWLGRHTALVLRGGRLQHPDAHAQDVLLDALRRSTRQRTPVCLALPGMQGAVDRLELVRADDGLSLAGERLALVRLGRRGAGPAAAPELLALAFGLTLAEARVLAALVQGQRAADIAERHKVRITTVRTQIAGLLAKMDCTRQSELVLKACTAI